MSNKTEKPAKEFFSITRVGRADLEGIGYDTSHVDDLTMEDLARKMANAYVENVFWIDLEILADYLEIPKKKGVSVNLQRQTN